MSNINELTAKLKAAAQAATPGPWLQAHRKTYDSIHKEEWYNTQVFTEDGEAIATLHWYPKPEFEGGFGTYRTDNAEFIALANPANILALTEALEVAEKRVLLPEHENVHYADAAEMEIAALRQRIAELEARTLTVKLPLMLDSSPHFNGGVKSAFKNFEMACAGAGLKLQIEGE